MEGKSTNGSPGADEKTADFPLRKRPAVIHSLNRLYREGKKIKGGYDLHTAGPLTIYFLSFKE